VGLQVGGAPHVAERGYAVDRIADLARGERDEDLFDLASVREDALHVADEVEGDALEPLARHRVVDGEPRPELPDQEARRDGAATNWSDVREPGCGQAPAVPTRASV
jgi:hypothetical protein